MQHVLTALKDIPGVVGSFVLNEKGILVSREMPAIYPDEIYPEMGRRLVGVYEAIALQVASLGDLVLKFEGYWFLCRRTAQCFLGILTTETVNFPALKMATNVALKQIDEQVASLPPLLAEKAVAAAPAVPTETKQKRFWRGSLVD
jgi:predicted regulator of Ras-like GTPase activity (Roadblock/LC7/MglB family)